MGAVAVPLNAALQTQHLEHALTDSGARALIVEADLLERLDMIRKPRSLEKIWVVGGVPGSPDALPDLPDELSTAHPVRPGDIAALLYTSGTTGPSKGVRCPHAQFYWWGVSTGEQLGITENDVLFTTLPLFHTNALNACIQALVAGATIVVGRRFSASRFWDQAREAEATVTYLLGAMVSILWSRERSPLDRDHRLRIALSPATPAALAEPFRDRFGVLLTDGFGSTETNSVIAAAPAKPRPGYLGQIQPDFEALVVDTDDQPVPDGVPGELILRSRVPFAFADGYHGRPQATAESWRNLWFHTGDRVIRDQDGWFRFVDRVKDVIRRRGENISSFEVEQVVGLLPEVELVAAFPVPSDMAEDEVMIAIVAEKELTPEKVILHCTQHLARFAVPRYVDFVTTMPTTSNGKIRKAALRERGLTESTWDREQSPLATR
ncbi:putative acid--CoA ligase [Gordonia aichiensis NBRC 108223]|uniref:Putative acid--CoA ligase n=2 Tax=Gordonia aichiensis TaxID=36820 RepID=L7KPD8_9ACTN|nr:putative acid--CoA ligase [Gordonia aichiensis NBRC 108223]